VLTSSRYGRISVSTVSLLTTTVHGSKSARTFTCIQFLHNRHGLCFSFHEDFSCFIEFYTLWIKKSRNNYCFPSGKEKWGRWRKNWKATVGKKDRPIGITLEGVDDSAIDLTVCIRWISRTFNPMIQRLFLQLFVTYLFNSFVIMFFVDFKPCNYIQGKDIIALIPWNFDGNVDRITVGR